jgi:taurine dioxygenase
MELHRRAPIGAEITGVDLASDLDAPTRDAIRAAWLEHRVLFFRDQHMDPAAQVRFASLFGEPDVYPFRDALPDHPFVVPIAKEKGDTANFGGGWHTDGSWQARPPRATVLHALEVPATGGDTLFADTTAAFHGLSEGLQQTLLGLCGVYTPSLVHGRDALHAAVSGDGYDEGAAELAGAEVVHPLVRTHPDTGARSIFCTPVHTHRIEGWTREESTPLIEFLMTHATAERYVVRFSWRPGTVALWDNRCLFHNALNDYAGERRCMHRVIVRGEEPA